MGQWFDARILAKRPAAAGLTELELDVRGTPLEGGHHHPGQFVKVSLGGEQEQLGEGYFAIASAPRADPGVIELLVKSGTPLTEALAQLAVGTAVRVGRIEGEGFPLDQARGREVFLFATGSGISPLRSLLVDLLRERDAFGKITLYFGARTPDSFAYADELDAWRAAGVDVRQTVSRPGDSGWAGLTGYVQEHVPEGDLSHATAFLCGQDEMVQGVTKVLRQRGMPGDRIFTNV